MKLADQRGIRSSKWVPNEILHADDINFISEAMYTNLTALLASIARPDAFGENEDIVMQGFTLNHNNLLTCDFSDGIACSLSGYYLLDGTWGFVASAGDIFSIVKPVTQSVAFTTGGTFARIDLLEVRPIRTAYDSKSRQFKDPITGLVTSSPIDTKYEYGYEFAVREGDDTSALTKEQTTWTVNTATVGSDIAGKYVLFSTRSGDYYIWYNTGASGDPAVSGRTGIEVSINAGDDKDAIALATRTELNSHQLVTDGEIVISGATNQFIITVDYYVNVTDGTNGDMGSFFDAISITQGNGVVYHTAGWIKIAEVSIGASATAITQNDIFDVRDSDQWENELSGTRFVRWRAEEIRIEDAAGRFTGDEVETALTEVPTFTELASVANGKGASLIGVEDASARFVGTKVEEVLNELTSSVLSLTAYESITARDAVGVYNNKIAKVGFFQIGGDSIVSSGGGTHDDLTELVGNKCLALYRESDSHLQVKVGTFNYSTGVMAWGSAYEVEAAGGVLGRLAHLGSDRFIVFYRESAGYDRVCRIGSVSGSVVTWETSKTIVEAQAASGTDRLEVKQMGQDDYFLCTYNDADDSSKVTARIGHYSGGSVVWDTSVTTLHGGDVNLGERHVTDVFDTEYFMTTTLNSAGNEHYLELAKFTGSAISSILRQDITSPYRTGVLRNTSVHVMPDKERFLISLMGSRNTTIMGVGSRNYDTMSFFIENASSHSQKTGVNYYFVEAICVGNYVITTQRGNAGTFNVGKVVGQNIVYLHENGDIDLPQTQGAYRIPICRLDGGAIVTLRNIVVGDYVYADVFRWVPMLGIAPAAISSGNTGVFRYRGIVGGFTGLIVGQTYYFNYRLKTIGLQGIEQIGLARSATELMLIDVGKT